ALRALMAARDGAVNAKRAGLCQLRDLLVTTPEPLRRELRTLSRARLLSRLSTTRPHRRHDSELRGTLLALRALAHRRRPHPSLIGPDAPLPTRPQRRQTTQPRTPPDHPHPTPNPPTDRRLHRASRPRRKEPPRGNPLPQTLPRPQALPTPRAPTGNGLTNIEAPDAVSKTLLQESRPSYSP